MIDEKEWLLQQQQALDAERRMLGLIDNLKKMIDLLDLRVSSLEFRSRTVAGEMQRKGGG